MPGPITLSIVEDDEQTRTQLLAFLGDHSNLRCIGAYGSGEQAIEGMLRQPPMLALVDINLPRMNGIACVARLKASLPKLQILMLTTYEDSDLIFESLRAGANGYLLKKSIPVELLTAIDQVLQGGAPMSIQIARKVVEHFHVRKEAANSEVGALTPREHEILALLAKGRLYKEIGDKLGISLGTVRSHIEHIYGKLHVQSRTEATLKYLQRDND